MLCSGYVNCSEKYFNRCRLLQPWVMFFCLILFAYSLIDGFVSASLADQQHQLLSILCIEMSAAAMSLFLYFSMSVFSIIYLIRGSFFVDTLSKQTLSLGSLFSFLCWLMGLLWIKSKLGTIWSWDMHFVVGLILLSLYSGVKMVRYFSREPIIVPRAGAVATLLGLMSIPAIYYFMDHWGGLFQDVHLDALWSSMRGSLLSMIAAFMLYYVWMLLVRIQYELLVAEKNSAWVRAMIEGD